jgi:hypothetical protein
MAQIAMLGDKRIEALRCGSSHLGFGKIPHLHPNAISLLDLYGRLSSKQRRELFSGGVAVGAFKEDQQRTDLEQLVNYGQIRIANDVHISKVGVYQNGRRIDKPEPPGFDNTQNAQLEPLLMTVHKLKETDTFDYNIVPQWEEGNTWYPGGSIEAHTKEEALTNLRQNNSDAKGFQIIGRKYNIEYNVIIQYADGSSKNIDVEIPMPTRDTEQKK